MLGQAEGVKEYNYSYFNVLKYDVASLRQNALANTSAALAPWLNWKSFCYHCAPSHYWQERVLHLALTGEHGRSCGPLGSGFSSLGCAAHTDRRVTRSRAVLLLQRVDGVHLRRPQHCRGRCDHVGGL